MGPVEAGPANGYLQKWPLRVLVLPPLVVVIDHVSPVVECAVPVPPNCAAVKYEPGDRLCPEVRVKE